MTPDELEKRWTGASAVAALVPDYVDVVAGGDGPLLPVVARLVDRGWADEEILDEFDRVVRFADHVERPSVRTRRAAEAYLAALRGERPRRQRGEPVATPQEAKAALDERGSERKAAAWLGISRTQLRRVLGKDD